MNTILTDDERPKPPEAQKYRRQQRHDGGYELVPAYTQEEMEAYANAREAAVLAKLREQMGKFINEQEAINHFLLTNPPAQADEGEVVVTWDHARTRILAVTRQNAEGQILKVIAQAPATAEAARAFGEQFAKVFPGASPEAPALPAEVREALKEAREAIKSTETYLSDLIDLTGSRGGRTEAQLGVVSAALARLDALGGGE